MNKFQNLQQKKKTALTLYQKLLEKLTGNKNISLTTAIRSNLFAKKDSRFIKILKELFLKNKLMVTAAILLVYLIYKWYKDKQFKVYCKKTRRNIKILGALDDLLRGYSPTLWLPGGIIKGFYLGMLPRLPYIGSFYIRETHSFDDGEVIALDFFPRSYKEMPSTTPFVVFIPGITGDSQDPYASHLCSLARDKFGFRVCVINRRGYGGMPIKGDMLSCFTIVNDIRMVTKMIKSKFPQSNIYLVGFSMGALQTHKFLQIYGNATDLKAACTVASPWDSFKTSEYVANNYLADRFLALNFTNHIKNHLHDPHFLSLLKKKGINDSKFASLIG